MMDINFEKFKGKIVDCITPSTNWRESEYVSVTIYFTDGTNLDINAVGEDDSLSIYD